MTKLSVAREILDYLAESRRTIHYTGWVGYRNLGDELLLEAARESLAPARIVWIRDFGSALPNWLINKRTHELAMLGGGTQIGERSPIDRFKQALARSNGGFVLGAGVTPALDGPVPAWLEAWGEVLRPLEYVGTRWSESADTLRRVGVRAQELGDPVCWFAKTADFWKPDPQLIGMNIGTSHGHMFGSEDTIQQNFIELAKNLLKAGHRIEFFCVWPEDLETTRRVAAAAGIAKPVIHEIYESATEFQEKVRRVQVFVGIKLHACALAMCSGVPTLIVGYREKCREFAVSVGAQDFCPRSDTLEVGQMLEMVDQLRTRGRAIADEMLAHSHAIRQRLVDVSRGILSRHGWTA